MHIGMDWYAAAPMVLIQTSRMYTALVRRANGPHPYQHGVKPHEKGPTLLREG